MANLGLAVLEEALRNRRLDRTLCLPERLSAIPSGLPERLDGVPCGPLDRPDPASFASTGIAVLDESLRGGLPRGQLSEIAGPRSSGRTTLLMQMLAAATGRGEIAALVDTCDRFDAGAAAAAGVDLDRLLWIRGDAISTGFLPPQATGTQEYRANKFSGSLSLCGPDRLVERALKALNLVLQAGGFGLVAIDLADVPVATLNRIPFTTWPRIQRTLEGRDTAGVLVGPHPLARSAGGVTLLLKGSMRWIGTCPPEGLNGVPSSGVACGRSRRIDGLDLGVRVVSPRRRVQGDICVCCDSRD